MGLIKEMNIFGFEGFWEETIVHCDVFEESYGTIEIARPPKIRPRSKHINISVSSLPWLRM